jgi:rhodanese-related sulfurtransferase
MNKNYLYTIAIIVIAIVIIGAVVFSGILDSEKGYIDLSAAEAKEMIDNNADLIVIDVSPHYDDGHLPGAIHYYGDNSLDDAIPVLDMDKDYLVYCHADGPSIAAANKLVDAGFSSVYRLQGNYAAWVDAGYPVET